MSVVEVIRAIVCDELRRLHLGDLGVVTSVFPHSSDGDTNNYECNVQIKNSGLELRRVPVATPVTGGAAIPSVQDLVLVTYVGGDANAPIVVGRLYNDEQRPPLNVANEIVYHLPLDADDESALHVALRSGGDHDPKRQVELKMGSKLTARLTDDDPLVVLQTDSATIQIAANGDIKIETQGKLQLTASGGVEMKSDANITIEASGAMKLKGATIDLN
jgi:uncharacterized protein involved in type VI secretion and phage assembly